MPAKIDSPKIGSPKPRDGKQASRDDALVIGLVNNMPDGAIKATERQFVTLLDAAAGARTVSLRPMILPDVPRHPAARAELLAHYEDVTTLAPGDVDALIVTGAEPRTERLEDEPYWHSFTRLVDWAKDNTVSSVFSCLAAHAAALHLDGIARRPLQGKLHGLFDCERRNDHPLTASMPGQYAAPHSRLNELALEELAAKGYQVLTGSARAGADLFVRDGESLFVFFQGHPEYDARSLLAEYHRDIVRFIKGERDAYPELPEGYLDAASTAAFLRLRERAADGAAAEKLLSEAAAATAAAHVSNTWRGPATSIYANWLDHIERQKSAARHSTNH